MTTPGERALGKARQARSRARRPRASRLAHALRDGRADLLAVTIVGLAILGLLGYVVTLPPRPLTFDMERQPHGVLLRNFYPLERNATGAFRWGKPEATLALPLVAPGDYRLTLTLQDLPGRAAPRTVTVWIAGSPVGTFQLAPTPRDYTVAYRVTPGTWNATPDRTLVVELQVPGVIPPDDPRALGIMLWRGELAPAQRVVWDPFIQPLHLLGVGLCAAAPLLLARAAGWQWQPNRPASRRQVAGALRGWLDRHRMTLIGGLGWAVALVVAARLTFSAIGVIATAPGIASPPCGGEWPPVPVAALHDSGPEARLIGAWQHWDACWYQHIAEGGYQPRDPAVAFFPLFPLLMRAAGRLAGDIAVGGLVVAGLASLAALLGVFRLVRADFGEVVARRAVVALALFPAAFFLLAPFTEALFLALAAWSLLAARRGAWGWAGLAAFFAGLTRAQGCLLALPLAWEAARLWWPARADPPDPDPPDMPRRVAAACVPLLPVGGFLLFLAYSRTVAGWTTFEVQRQLWGYRAHPPWAVVADSWRFILERGAAVEAQIEAVNLGLFLLVTILLVVGARRMPLAYLLYAAPQLLLLAARQNIASPLMSASRLTLVLFPAFIVLAALMRRRSYAAWLLVSTALLVYLCYLFARGVFVA